MQVNPLKKVNYLTMGSKFDYNFHPEDKSQALENVGGVWSSIRRYQSVSKQCWENAASVIVETSMDFYILFIQDDLISRAATRQKVKLKEPLIPWVIFANHIRPEPEDDSL